MTSRRHRLPAAVIVVLSMLWPAFAHAHALAPALLELHELGGGAAALKWKLSSIQPRGARVEPQLPAGCRTVNEPAVHMDVDGVTYESALACDGGSLSGKRIGMSGLHGSDTNVVVRVTLADGRVLSSLLSAETPSLTIPERPSRGRLAREYGALGAHHLITGFDHVLFVLGLLLLVRGARPLVATVSAFTLGHSMTLSLAMLGVVSIAQPVAELAIALSILVLGAEIVSVRRGARSVIARKPWLMASAFGLLHGLGFAAALRSIGLPHGEIPLALAAFNVGIELGQVGIVVSALVVATLSRAVVAGVTANASSAFARTSVWASVSAGYAIGSAAAFWFFERLEPALRSLGV